MANKPKEKVVRKGFTKIHRAPKDIQNAVMTQHSRGLTYTAIQRFLKREFDYKVTRAVISKYIKSKEKKIGQHVYDSEEFSETIYDELANVMTGLSYVQQELRNKFREALKEDDPKSISQYARLINENVETAYKIIGDPRKQLKSKPTKSFGQAIEKLVQVRENKK